MSGKKTSDELARDLGACVGASIPIAQELQQQLTLYCALKANPSPGQSPPEPEGMRDLAVKLWKRLSPQK